ncbi:MAG: DUF4159 domain-containing protein [Rhodobiaceae bacterium]|nr:DUF4159 domain-containing protein [Rhodobiaceae bacterium]MCC0056387.1 DUF4159 domain-containing protein [Rhodobiaceae bacterium]
MSALGLIGFAQPLILAALIALPAIWWLLRYTPPRPQRETFPPTRILREIEPAREERATSPWWLTLLRMLIATLLILALAGPTLNPTPARLAGEGPVLILIDNGWPSARLWSKMQNTARSLIEEAGSTDRMVHVVATGTQAAVPPAADSIEALDRLRALKPESFAPERMGTLGRLRTLEGDQRPGEIIWLSDGLDHGDATRFAAGLADIFPTGQLLRIEPAASDIPLALGNAEGASAGISARVLRRDGAGQAIATVEARDARGRLVASADATFGPGDTEATASFEMPVELRNAVTRLEIAGARNAGAVRLLDDRFRRRTVGLASGATRDIAQPLLDPLHYIAKALQPVAELRVPAGADIALQIDQLVNARVNAIVLADIGTLPEETVSQLDQWVRDGGLLIRFAGPRLANGRDSLLPVTLRPGERVLGGPLSWSEPQALGGLRDGSPLAGLELPEDVTVNRQILAEPSAGLADATWAWLADGTPLVTGSSVDKGRIVLFHVTADARWSNLPLTGLFSQMLGRLVDLAGRGGPTSATASQSAVPLRPLRLLDANGVLVDAAGDATPLPVKAPPRGTAENPPGLYGDNDSWRALNALAADETLRPLQPLDNAASILYPDRSATDLAPWAFLATLILLLADTLAVLLLGGMRGVLRRIATAATLIAICIMPPPVQAQQQPGDAQAMAVVGQTSLAYVVTGDRRLDDISKAGLEGLSRMLAARTAFEPGPPVGVDPATDEMAFFTLIYWPVRADSPPVTERAVQRIDAFMKQGGTVLFDTGDQLQTAFRSGNSPNQQRLAELLSELDLPELEPVPADHVLTKSFYLLSDFPGRFQGAPLWVERLIRQGDSGDRPARGGDGVSPLLVTGNDFAAAWATDQRGQPLYPVTPGGERQREISYRVGINIVMYTLTGNYKADQVHIPALLERLGQ